MAKRHRPLTFPIVVSVADDGRGWFIHFTQPDGSITGFHLHDYLLSRESVRFDNLQMFASYHDEDAFVASFHFPFASGQARQAKIVWPIKGALASDIEAREKLQSDEAAAFLEQAQVDFEQLTVNFFSAALPALRKAAYLIARSNPKSKQPSAPPNTSDVDIEPPPGMEEYIVNISSGWPRWRPRFKVHDVVILDPGFARHDVESGYLVPVKEAEKNMPGWGDEYRNAIATYRESRRRARASWSKRPKPTDTEEFLRTREGNRVREQIAKEMNTALDRLFPPLTGRPLGSTPAEREALIAELRDDFNERAANYKRRGTKKTQRAVYAEMAEQGRYGPEREALSAATIEKLLSAKSSVSNVHQK